MRQGDGKWFNTYSLWRQCSSEQVNLSFIQNHRDNKKGIWMNYLISNLDESKSLCTRLYLCKVGQNGEEQIIC